MNFLKLISLLFLFSSFAFAADKVIINPRSNQDTVIKVNDGGVINDVVRANAASSRAEVSKITGASGGDLPIAGDAILGSSGTASQNIKLHRGSSGLQILAGDDATVEGTDSTALSKLILGSNYKLSKQSVGSVGAVSNDQGALVAGDFPGAASTTSFYSLEDVNDDSTNGRNLTNNGSATFVAEGFFGRSVVRLDGSSQYLSSSSTFFDGGKSFSIGFRFKKRNAYKTSHALFSLGSSSSDRVMSLIVESNENFRLFATNTAGSWDTDVANISYGETGTNPMVDGWITIAVTYNNSTNEMVLYVNGQVMSYSSSVTVRAATTALLRIGVDIGGTNPTDIDVQDFFFTENVLSHDEANQIYSKRFAGSQLKGAHILTASSFPMRYQGSSYLSFFNLQADANDDSGNGRTLTNGASTPFTGLDFNGISGAARTTTIGQGFSSADSHFIVKSGNVNRSFVTGIWFVLDKCPAESAGSNFFGMIGSATNDAWRIVRVSASTNFSIQVSTDTTLNQTLETSPGSTFGFYPGWHQLVVRYDDATPSLDIFLDGAEIRTFTLNDRMAQPGGTGTFYINGNAGETNRGTYRDFFMLQGMMTDAEITKLYSAVLSHSQNIDPGNQDWRATYYTGDNDDRQQDLGKSWIVDMLNNDLYVNFGLQPQDQIQLKLRRD